MKSRHIINAILFGIVFALAGWFTVFYGAWFVPTWWLELSALALALPLSAYFAFVIIPRDRHKIGRFALPNTIVVKVGGTLVYAAVLWMLLAQSIPAAITNVLGEAQTMRETTRHFSRTTLTCGNRLVLSSTNPPGGGFCRAGASGTFSPGADVIITYKASKLGLSVLRLEAS